MADTYEFIEKLKDHGYRCSPEELKKLVEFTTNCREFRVQKIEKIAREICYLGHADDCDVNADNYGHRSTIYYMTFFIGVWTLRFNVDFDEDEQVKLFEVENVVLEENNVYNFHIDKLSVGAVAFVLELFKNHGEYADENNPNIDTLFNDHKKLENIKSARTVL